MPFGEFDLVVDWSNVDNTAREASVSITPIPWPLNDGNEKFYDRVKDVPLSGVTTFSLRTDATVGDSTSIGYHVLLRTKSSHASTVALDVEFWAKPAGATVALAEVTPQVVEPVAPTAENAQRAENAADVAVAARNTATSVAITATGSATAAAGSATTAGTARTGAESARDTAVAARDVTTAARDVATSARDTATGAATTAGSSATNAGASEANAASSATAAQTARTGAESARSGAESARNEAQAFGGTNNAQVAAMVTGAGATKDALSGTLITRVQPSTVAYNSDGTVATETLPIGTSGNLVKTYSYNSSGLPSSCAWNFPGSATDYVETFTYDGSGNPTGSTFAAVV